MNFPLPERRSGRYGKCPAAAHRDLIITLAGRQRLPAIYPFRYFAHSGGLLSYEPTTIDPYIRAAVYVDRILKGEKQPTFQFKYRPSTS
jgi:hypothetical protein